MKRVFKKSIVLKDGSLLNYEQPHHRNFNKWTLLRYGAGSYALMRISNVEEDRHGFRIYGMNIVGESHSAYAHNCTIANEKDRIVFNSMKHDRTYSYLQNTDDDVGYG